MSEAGHLIGDIFEELVPEHNWISKLKKSILFYGKLEPNMRLDANGLIFAPAGQARRIRRHYKVTGGNDEFDQSA